MRRRLLSIAALAMTLAVPGIAQIPRGISYQGILTDTLGNPKPDGTCTFTFRFYESATGGSPIWEEQKALPVKRGLFTTTLGNQVAIGPGLTFDRQYWLGVAVADDEEMSPRIPMTASAYSLNAAMADTARYALTAPPAAAVDSARITGTVADNCITSAKIVDETIRRSDLAADFVAPLADTASFARSGPHTSIADSARISGTVGDGSIATVKLQDGAVTRSKLADTLVTGEKIALPISLIGDFTGRTVMSVCNEDDYNHSHTTVGISTVVRAGHALVAATVHGSAIDAGNISGTYAHIAGADDAFIGYSGTMGRAGYFLGRVEVTGQLTKGSGAFKIDHPLDPQNRYLYHSFVESPDMKNMYDGVVVLDGTGSATVQLPRYFEALNSDFRYQLTCVGGFAPVYISQEISGNAFRIGGGRPGQKVSWQVTGIRQDPFARAHRIIPEEEKTAKERGTYIHPDEYGVPPQQGLEYDATRQGIEIQRYFKADKLRSPANPGPRQ
jgi:hypothetical protein